MDECAHDIGKCLKNVWVSEGERGQIHFRVDQDFFKSLFRYKNLILSAIHVFYREVDAWTSYVLLLDNMLLCDQLG